MPTSSSSTSSSSTTTTASSTKSTSTTASSSTSSTSTPTTVSTDPLASSASDNTLLYILAFACFALLVIALGCWARRRPRRIIITSPKPTAAPVAAPAPAPAPRPVSTAQYGSPIVEQVEYVTVGRTVIPEPPQPQPIPMPQPILGYPSAALPPPGVGGTVPGVMSFALPYAATSSGPQEVAADPMRLHSTVPRTDSDDFVLPGGR